MNSCIECGSRIVGRSDKKFCNGSCRNAYHNEKSRDELNSVRRTNRILGRNRRILLELKAEGIQRVHRKVLMALGFSFDHFTAYQEFASYGLCPVIYDEVYFIQEGGMVYFFPSSENLRQSA
jgi:hypothetical protein